MSSEGSTSRTAAILRMLSGHAPPLLRSSLEMTLRWRPLLSATSRIDSTRCWRSRLSFSPSTSIAVGVINVRSRVKNIYKKSIHHLRYVCNPCILFSDIRKATGESLATDPMARAKEIQCSRTFYLNSRLAA